jgi:hypothetical protein
MVPHFVLTVDGNPPALQLFWHHPLQPGGDSLAGRAREARGPRIALNEIAPSENMKRLAGFVA